MRTDPFSFTKRNAPLITHDWGSEIAFALVWRWFGWSGIAMLASALIATLVYLLHRQLLAEGNDWLSSTAMVLVTAMACSIHWLARPLLITHILFCIFQWQLRSYGRGCVSLVPLCVRLGLLMICWVNLHGAFFAGFVLIVMYLVGALSKSVFEKSASNEDRGSIAGYGAVLLVCLAASLINPNGWRLHAHIVEFLRSPLLTTVTPEFASPNFHSNGTRGFLLLLGCVLIAITRSTVRMSVTDFVVIGGWATLALYSTRNIPLFAIVCAPILAPHIVATIGSISHMGVAFSKVTKRLSTVESVSGGHAWIIAIVVSIGWLLWHPDSQSRLAHTRLRAEIFPEGAVTFLQHDGMVTNKVIFNEYDWGGYISFRLPTMKVFTDGRNDFYGPDLVRDYLRVCSLSPQWEDVFRHYGINCVLMPSDAALSNYLRLRPDWKTAYVDPNAIVLIRDRE